MKDLGVSLVAVEEAHCLLLWRWVNEPMVRAMSFASEDIPWTIHQRWFADKIKDSRARLYLVMGRGDQELGLVRFELNDDGDWELGISLDKRFRGQGLASQVIMAGCRQLMSENGCQRIVAHTRPRNLVFKQAATRAGFVPDGQSQVNGQTADSYVFAADPS